jgi:predicted metalloprotease with PDZ domain
MLKFFAVLILLFAVKTTSAQLIYTVDLNSTQKHKVEVTVDVKNLHAKKITYQMPIWAPGAYSVTHYGHYVTDFKTFDISGNSVPVKEINGDRWEANGKKVIEKITYFVGDSHKDSTSLYFALAHIDTNFFFANGTCLFGYVNDKKNIPAEVQYDFPSLQYFGGDTLVPRWKLATALDPQGYFVKSLTPGKNTDTITTKYLIENPNFYARTTFKAKNYDELADAPVMAGKDFQIRSFKDGKAWYDIVLASDRAFPMDSLEECIKKIVRAETDFFHDTPYNHYTFLINAPTFFKSPSAGQGALEHANSSAYLLVNLPWSTFKTYGPDILAHEFFHLWNVKRIHSSLLGPFDYTKRVMTTSLWLSEGITDYYAHTILTRYGILPYKTFERMVTDLSAAANNSKAAKNESLEQLSIDESDFDIGKATVFYFKGTIIGLLLDIEIRSRTNNTKSLDDVMLALNAEAKQGKTFKDNELIGKMEKITGLDLQDFYKKYIAGTDSLPVEEYLLKMGVGKTNNSGVQTIKKSYVGDYFLGDLIPTQQEGKIDDIQFVFYKVPDNTPEKKAGVQIEDTLKAINGEPFTMKDFGNFDFKPPVTYEIEVGRTSGRKILHIVYDKPRGEVPPASSNSDEQHKSTKSYKRLPNATPLEVAIRHGIVGKDY